MLLYIPLLIVSVVWIYVADAAPYPRASGSTLALGKLDTSRGLMSASDSESGANDILKDNLQVPLKIGNNYFEQSGARMTVMDQALDYSPSVNEDRLISPSPTSYASQATIVGKNVGPSIPTKLEPREDEDDGEDHEYDNLTADDPVYLMAPWNVPGLVDWLQNVQETIEGWFGIHHAEQPDSPGILIT